MTATTTRLSIAEFEQMPEPDQPGKQELLGGELIQLPPAKLPHSRIIKALYELLRTVLLDRLEIGTGYQMSPDTWLVSDVSITWPDQPVKNDYFQGSPMIAIEVVSPSNGAGEIDLKVDSYLTCGALEVWIIYPRTRHMMVHKTTMVERITDTYLSDSLSVAVRLSEILDVQNT